MTDFDPKLKAEALERFNKNPRCGICLKHIKREKDYPISFWDVRGPRYMVRHFCSGWCCHRWARMEK